MNKKSFGTLIIVSAIIWGAVIIGCSLKLKGTGYYDDISNILYAGVITHLLLVWLIGGAVFRKSNKLKEKDSLKK